MESKTQPQWAIDAARTIYDDGDLRPVGSTAKIHFSDVSMVAAIIARHAPAYESRLAELDAENARLREALTDAMSFYRQYEDRNCLCAEAIESMQTTILAALDK